MSYSLSLSRGGWDGRIHHTLVRRRMTSLVPRWGEGPGVRLEDEKCLFCQCTMKNQPVLVNLVISVSFPYHKQEGLGT